MDKTTNLQIDLQKKQENGSSDNNQKYFLMILDLFQTKLTIGIVKQLQEKYCVSDYEVKIKHYDAFDQNEFYLLVFKDILCNLLHFIGTFEERKNDWGELIQAFLYCSKLNSTQLQDNKIKFCCSILHQFIYTKNRYFALSSLSNFIHNAYKIDSQLFIDNKSDLINRFNLDFYETIRKYVKFILLKTQHLRYDPKKEKDKQDNEQNRKDKKENENTEYEIKQEQKEKQIEDQSIESTIQQEKIKTQFDKSDGHFDLLMSQIMQFQIISSFEEFKQYVDVFSSFFPYLDIEYDARVTVQLGSLTEVLISSNSEVLLCLSLIQNYAQFVCFKTVSNQSVEESLDEFNDLMDSLILYVKYKDYTQEITNIINNELNILYFNQVLKSNAVREYYASSREEVLSIQNHYNSIPLSTLEDIKKRKSKIMNTIIVVPFDRLSKAITTGYLRVAINPMWIRYQAKNESELTKLITAYVLITLLHESNHYLKRYPQIGEEVKKVKTPRDLEGGKELLNYLFNRYIINRINLTTAEQLLSIESWESCKKLKQIISNERNQKDSWIQYMTTEKEEDFINCVPDYPKYPD